MISGRIKLLHKIRGLSFLNIKKLAHKLCSWRRGGARFGQAGVGVVGHFAYFPIKVIFMPYSSDFHSFKICFMLVSLNCPTSKITIFSFYTKSLQRTRTPHILMYLLNIVINLYHALAWVCILIFNSNFYIYFQICSTRAYKPSNSVYSVPKKRYFLKNYKRTLNAVFTG